VCYPGQAAWPYTKRTHLKGGANDLRLGQAETGHKGLDRPAEEQANPTGGRAGVVGDEQHDPEHPANGLPGHFAVLLGLCFREAAAAAAAAAVGQV